MKKATKQAPNEQTTQNIAIDIGYGDTKVMYDGKFFKFPSAISQVRQAQVILNDKESDTYAFNGSNFKVGQKATRDAVPTRGFNFLFKYSPLLIAHALKLAKVDTSKPIALATGLSLLNYKEASNFMKVVSKFSVNDEVYHLKTSLFAQGQGIFVEYPNQKDDKLICIIDIGYNTLDFLVFEDNEPSNELCFANQNGANKVIVDLQKLVSREYSVDFSEQEAKKVFLSKKLVIAGQEIDFSDTINSMTTQYADAVMDSLNNQAGDIIKRADAIIVSGGGAYFLDIDYIRKQYPHIHFSELPYEFANVRGYYRAAFSGGK